MKSCKAVLSLTALLLTTVTLGLAQGTYTQIDVPGALNTNVNGLDTAGELVGEYFDASNIQHGFIFSAGSYTTVDYPGSQYTGLAGINDNGQAVGGANGPDAGFLYNLKTESFTAINLPQSSYSIPIAINNAGALAGYALLNGRSQQVGFELIRPTYKLISPPRTSYSSVSGITASGALFGITDTLKGRVNFSLADGKYSEFAIPGAPGALLSGVNPLGTALVGSYTPSSGVIAGFIYEKQTLTTLQFPTSTYTVAVGINASGEVVGLFLDSTGAQHGFTWTPPADAAKK
jgi:probable HAF family extracellular repeat protein